MDKFKIDSHKLIYHVSRVDQWLRGEDVYPIYIEVGLHGGCNHRCIFCAFDFLNYRPNILNEVYLKKFLLDAAKSGVKAILYSGEGEPLLYSKFAEIITFTKQKGIDVALSTNGVLFDQENIRQTLPYLTWIRISLNAGTAKSYASIQGAKEEDFRVVINNIKEAVKIRNKNKYPCTIGVQFLLIPQNYKEVVNLAYILKDIGVDYLIIKPFSFHPSSKKKLNYYMINYEKLLYLKEKLKSCEKNNFQIIFRQHAMNKLAQEKTYHYCLGLSFAAHITASGDVVPCNAFVGTEKFTLGNISKSSFRSIWKSKRRKKIVNTIYKEWDVNKCRKSCRLDEINRYLWELKNPNTHVNFI